MAHRAQAFIDGGYLRSVAEKELGRMHYPDPYALARSIVTTDTIRTWCLAEAHGSAALNNILLARSNYYDATDEQSPAELQEYLDAVELLPDTSLGLGSLRRAAGRKRLQQKGVDVLLAVQMLTGSMGGIFDVAVLVAGDADFVPLVEEAKRHGTMVVVAAGQASIAADLRRSADRFVRIGNQSQSGEVALSDLALGEQKDRRIPFSR